MLAAELSMKMERVSRNRASVLSTRQEQCRERAVLTARARARRDNAHSRSLIHGTSLLESLDNDPTVLVRPPSRGGVAFHVDIRSDTPCYEHPVLKKDTKFVSSSLDTIQEDEEQDEEEDSGWIIDGDRMYRAPSPVST